MCEISVIIATYNRCDKLKDALDSLLVQDTGGIIEYEVLVMDNKSTDRTREVVQAYTAKSNGLIRYYYEPRRGKSFALNTGINESRGVLIATTDDDCVPEKNWLKNIYDYFRSNEQADIVLGFAALIDGKPFYASNDLLRGNGLNMIFQKKLIAEIGGFDTYLGPGAVGCGGEDTEFVYRAQRRGKKIINNDKIKVIHKLRDSLQQRYKYTFRDTKSLMIFWLKYILLKRDTYALKNIYWFFRDVLTQLISGIKNKDRERTKLKIVQFCGASVGLLKGIWLWLVTCSIDKLFQK